ncbi:MAG: phosphoribosylglycinamide formyltransferase [Candidatus Ancaeobacter aquaticus]|nr:phosphoribosylglycinamide formyltransferase [Candidatus Ancaeobacter aquaticus]
MKIGVLGSGKGSNFDAIYEAAESSLLDVDITVVISDVENSLILKKAKERGIKSFYMCPGKHKTWLEPDIEKEYVNVLRENGVELIVLAGFMRVIKDPLLLAFPGKIVNIHPSLLPSFRGLKAWEQAVTYGVKYAGCTVHFVEKDVDTGPIICQAVVPVNSDDTPEDLHKRIQVEEHRIYPQAIDLVVKGNMRIENRKIILTE